MRSLFRQVVLKCVFVFRSNSLVNPKDLCFSGVDGTRRGLLELKYIYLTVWRYKVVRIVDAPGEVYS